MNIDTNKSNSNMDFYRVLGVSRSANQKEIKTAYFKAALNSHPDKIIDPNLKEDAEAMFKKINEAYHTLSDENLRSKYDEEYDGELTPEEISGVLHIGKVLSDQFRTLLGKWYTESFDYSFYNNIQIEIDKIMKELICPVTAPNISGTKTKYQCPTCHLEDVTQKNHEMQFITAYQKFIQESIGSPESYFAELTNCLNGFSKLEFEPIDQWIDHLTKCHRNIQNKLEHFKTKSNIILNSSWYDDEILPLIQKYDLKIFDTELNLPKIKKLIYTTRKSRSYAPSLWSARKEERYPAGTYDVINGLASELESVPQITITHNPIESHSFDTCQDCKSKFWLFRNRDYCRVCYHNFCSKCLTKIIVPKLGYYYSVGVCKLCIKNVEFQEPIIWLTKACNSTDTEACKMIQISSLYDLSLNRIFKRCGDYFFSGGSFHPAIYCYQYAEINRDEWKELIVCFVNMRCYDVANWCLSIMDSQGITKERQIEMGDYYFNKIINDEYINALRIAIFFYHQSGVKCRVWYQKIINLYDRGIYQLCGFLISYLTQAHKKHLTEITNFFIDKQKIEIVAEIYFRTKDNLAEWFHMIDELLIGEKYETAIYFWKYLNQKYVIDIGAITNQSIKYLHFHLISEIDLDSLVFDLVLSLKKGSIYTKVLLIIFMLEYRGKYLVDHYLKTGQYEHAFFCFQIGCLEEKRTETWIDLGHRVITGSINDAFRCYTYGKAHWIELGDHLFSMGRFTSALHCYLYSTDDTNIHIFDQAKKLISNGNIKKAYLYLYHLIKRNFMTSDIIYLVEAVHAKNPIFKKLVIAHLKSCDLLDKKYILMHDCLCKIMEIDGTDLSLVIGCLHSISRHDQSTYASDKLKIHVPKYETFRMHQYYQQIKKCAYERDSISVANLIGDICTYQYNAINMFVKEQLGITDITTITADYRAILYMLLSALRVFETKYAEAISLLQESLICHPHEMHIKGITILLQNENIQNFAYASFLVELKNDFFKQTIEMPINDQYQVYLKGSKLLKAMKKFELAIVNGITNHEEAALLYIDLTMSVNDAAGLIGCFLLASYHFILAQLFEKDVGKIYAYRNAIFQLSASAHEISQRYLVPPMQIYIGRQILKIIIKSNANLTSRTAIGRNMQLVIGEHESYLLSIITKNTIQLAKVSPIHNYQTTLACDTVYLDLISRNYLEPYLMTLSENPKSLCPSFLADYYLLEGSWKGWFHDDSQFVSLREKSMKSLLRSQKWNMNDVQHHTNWQLFPTDKNGWIDVKSSLNFCIDSYTHFHGIQLNKKTGEISYLLDKSKRGGLFTHDDIKCIMVMGIRDSFFTLDQPNYEMKNHPFQEMKYYPSNLMGTDYLATLLRTDYLLKMFSMGIDVCTMAPFVFRDITEGCLEKLPKKLQEVLKPIHLRDDTHTDNAHRFWIEAGKLIYDTHETDDFITWKFSDVKMRVKKHLLKYDSNGKLIDDENDIEDDESAESQFARDFTKHYDAIGEYFPEFLRLKELLKIGAAYAIIQSVYQSTQQQISELTIDVGAISQHLYEIKTQIKDYPLNTNYHIEKEYQNILSINGIYEYNVAYTEQEMIKQKIKDQLSAADYQMINQIAGALSKSYHGFEREIQPLVSSWFYYYDTYTQNKLVNALGSSLRNYIISQKKIILDGIDSMNIDVRPSEGKVSLGNNGECPWVPAAYCHNISSEHKRIKIYGGVNMGLNLQSGGVGGRTYQIYSARVLERSGSVSPADRGHRFPMSFDSHIINNGTMTTPPSRDGRTYNLYTMPGTLGSSQGRYEVGVRPIQTAQGNTINLVTHRVFRRG